MSSAELSLSDFNKRAETEAELQVGVTSFTFPVEKGAARVTWYSRKGHVAAVSLTLPSEYGTVAGHLNAWQTDEVIEYIYPAEQAEVLGPLRAYSRSADQLAPVSVRELPLEERTPRSVGATAVADLLLETDPRRILFYTGAGASGGGEAPIRDYHTLKAGCGFALPESRADAEQNERFIQAFLSSPEKGEYMWSAYQQTLDVLYRDTSSPAHIALAAMARLFNLEPSFVTTNYDLKHEAKGSRIAVPKLVTGWHDLLWPGFSPAHRERRDRTVRQLDSIRGGGVDLLLAIGAAADRRGAIEWLNPEIIVAVNGDEVAQIPYLGKRDYHLKDDAQVAVPAIAREVRRRMQKKMI